MKDPKKKKKQRKNETNIKQTTNDGFTFNHTDYD